MSPVRAPEPERARRRLVAVAVVTASFLGAAQAEAAGLYFSERGVRPLGRGGAFTAGADDLGAIWYNPAGVYDAGSQFLFDASWLNFTTEYTRRSLIQQRDPNTGQVVSEFEQTFPQVEGSSPIIPIPTLAGSFQVADDWVIAIGVEAPYSAITSFPEEVDGQPAASRYSLITMEGSALAVIGAWVAYRPHEDWRIGMGLQILAGRFVTTTMFGACVPEKFFCAPEQPEWDTLTQLSVGPIVAPSGNIGVKWLPHEQWKVGIAFQAPTVIRAPAEIRVRLPGTPAFETAYIDGTEADVAFELPWSLRWGVQFEPIEDLALEIDGSWEGWSIHDEIGVYPNKVTIHDLPGFPNPYQVPEVTIPRNFQDSLSVRVGGEYEIDLTELALILRGGFSFESSAIPPEYMSVLTIDMPKLTTGLGLGLEVDAWRFDMVFAHVFGLDVSVDPREAKSPQLMPVEANVQNPHVVNGGDYSARANVLGIGLRYAFDYEDEESEVQPAAPQPAAAAEAPAGEARGDAGEGDDETDEPLADEEPDGDD